MARGSVDIGPLRCVRGPERGIVDVHFDGRVLVLVPFRGLALVDRYRLVLVGLAVVAAIAAWYAGNPARPVLLVVAVALAAAAAVLVLLDRVRTRHGGSRVEVPEPEITLMDPLVEGLRPLLVLHTEQGEIALTGWPWRASQLRRLQLELGRD